MAKKKEPTDLAVVVLCKKVDLPAADFSGIEGHCRMLGLQGIIVR